MEYLLMLGALLLGALVLCVALVLVGRRFARDVLRLVGERMPSPEELGELQQLRALVDDLERLSLSVEVKGAQLCHLSPLQLLHRCRFGGGDYELCSYHSNAGFIRMVVSELGEGVASAAEN